MAKYDGGEPVNIGSGQEIDIKGLVYAVAGIVGYEGAFFFDSTKPNGQPRRLLDVSKAKELFGFESRTPLGEGLRKTVEWYLQQNQWVAGFWSPKKGAQMARKREKLKGLDYSSREYWNRLLAEEGMSMSAGLNLHRLVYTGDSQSLDKIQEEQSERDTGRVPPAKGAE
jgi:hypothetical protein